VVSVGRLWGRFPDWAAAVNVIPARNDSAVGMLYVRQSDPVRHELQVMFSDRKPEVSYLPAVAQGAWLGPFCSPGSLLFDRLLRAKKDQPPPDLRYFNQSRK
jgi:hypothetical protein